MAISMDNLNRSGDPAHVIICHGGEGSGKTTLFASLPNPVILQTERGKGNNAVPSWRINSFADLTEAFCVAVDSGEFKSIILDSLDHAEPLVWAEAVRRNNLHAAANKQWKTIEDPGYGAGYVAADLVWQDLWEMIESAAYDMGLVVAMTAHSKLTTFQDPEGPSYDRWQMKLHKRADAFFREKADMVLFAKHDTFTSEIKDGMQKRTIGVGNDSRSLYAERRPAFDAKNRHDLPAKVSMGKPFDWSVYAAAFPEGFFDAK